MSELPKNIAEHVEELFKSRPPEEVSRGIEAAMKMLLEKAQGAINNAREERDAAKDDAIDADRMAESACSYRDMLLEEMHILVDWALAAGAEPGAVLAKVSEKTAGYIQRRGERHAMMVYAEAKARGRTPPGPGPLPLLPKRRSAEELRRDYGSTYDRFAKLEID